MPDRTKAAVVHLYRSGAGAERFTVTLDGEKILKLGNHKLVTFYIEPGKHELSLKFGNRNPTALVNAVAGQEYFVHADCEVSVERAFFNGPNAVSLSLEVERGIENPDKVKPEALDDAELSEVYAVSLRGLPKPSQRASSPPSSLSDDEVEGAVVAGSHNDSPESVGLFLNDTQMNVGSHVLAPDYANSGFSIKVYTPQRWIEYQSALAHRLMKPFAVADVTPEMRLNVLHVIALPRTPERLNGRGMSAAASVARVVLMDRQKAETIQPIAEQQSEEVVDSALRSKAYGEIWASFRAEDVHSVRAADKNGEFYVVVIGDDGSRKFFDVKAKFKNWL